MSDFITKEHVAAGRTGSENIPWLVEESPEKLQLIHDYRWLRVIGFPLAAIGLIGSVGIWFLPGIPYQDAWPMLAVGSLIGSAFALMGMHLSFNLLTFTADRHLGTLTRREGFGPFIRIRNVSLERVLKLP